MSRFGTVGVTDSFTSVATSLKPKLNTREALSRTTLDERARGCTIEACRKTLCQHLLLSSAEYGNKTPVIRLSLLGCLKDRRLCSKVW